MNPAEEFFSNVLNKVGSIASGPSDLMRKIGDSFNNPYVMPALLGLGCLFAFKLLYK